MQFVALVVTFIIGATLAVGQSAKNYKDRAEYDVYNEVAKDFAANNFSKALTDLERWSVNYSDSEFNDDRQMLYVQAYAGTNQLAKAVDAAELVLSNKPFASQNSASALRVLYAVVSAIQRIPDATPPQLATAGEAAHQLDNFQTAPDGMSASAWESTRADLRSAAMAARLYIAVTPASQAVKANNCTGAEAAAMKAIGEFPKACRRLGFSPWPMSASPRRTGERLHKRCLSWRGRQRSIRSRVWWMSNGNRRMSRLTWKKPTRSFTAPIRRD